jgi:hypothetical protein
MSLNVLSHDFKFETVAGTEHVCTACTEMCSEESTKINTDS